MQACVQQDEACEARREEVMSEVKRLEHNGDDLVEDPDGTYVFAADYDAA